VSDGLAEIPDVVGESEDDAIAILEDAGFEVDRQRIETDEAEEGTVFDQTPDAGTGGLPGTTVVTIYVAEAPEEPTPPTETPTTQPTTPTTPTFTLPTGDND
jgi:eukaryotic-like serine/threonine-protein kinase